MTLVDSGQLPALRLSEAGIDVTLDEYTGGHTTSNTVPELIGYLKAAAADWQLSSTTKRSGHSG